MQCRVQRALWDLKGFARDLMDALRDRPAVHWLERERFENQEVERALRQVESGVGHGSTCASTGRREICDRSCRSARGPGERRPTCYAAKFLAPSGMRMKKLLPRPFPGLSAQIAPPCRVMNSFAM